MMSTTKLCRQLSAGESLSFDGGRVVITMVEKSGRRASLRLDLAEDVVVDKPRTAANDESQAPRGIDFSK